MTEHDRAIERAYAERGEGAALLPWLDDPDPAVREAVASALGAVYATDGGQAGDAVVDRAVAALVARLTDPEPEVRRAVAWALGSMQAGGAVVALGMAAAEPGVGEMAAAALLAMPSSRIAPTVDDADVTVALCRLAERDDRRPAALKSLLRHGRRGMEACLRLARIGEADQVASAVAAVGPAALPLLAPCLGDGRRDVALRALRALGEGASPLVGPVAALLRPGTDADTDAAVLDVLVAAGPDALDALVDVLDRGSVGQRRTVVALARADGRREWVALAAEALGDPHDKVRYDAARWAVAAYADALGELLDALAATDPDADVRFAARG